MWELGNGSRQRPHQKGPIIDSLSPAPNQSASNCLHGLLYTPSCIQKCPLAAQPGCFASLFDLASFLHSCTEKDYNLQSSLPSVDVRDNLQSVFAFSLTQSPSPRTLPPFELSQRLLPYRPYRCCTLNPLPVCDRHVFLCGLNYCCRPGFGLFSERSRPTTVTPALGKIPARCTYHRRPLSFRITIAASNASNASNAMTRCLAAQIVLIIQALDA